jgi:hypothetical protein
MASHASSSPNSFIALQRSSVDTRIIALDPPSPNEEGYRTYIDTGERLVPAGSDLSFLMVGAAAASKLIRTIK